MYNGTPGLRLWQIGTHHQFGLVADPGSQDVDIPKLPSNLQRVFKPFKNNVYGNFELCPLDGYRKGYMQPAHLIAAKNLLARPY